MSKGKRPDPLPPFRHDGEGEDDEPTLALPAGRLDTNGPGSKGTLALAGGIPADAIVPALDRLEKMAAPLVAGVKEAVRRGVEAHEQLANEALWARRVSLVALASDNGKASEEEAKGRLRRMVALLDELDEIEAEIFPDAEGDEPDDDEDPGEVPPARRFR